MDDRKLQYSVVFKVETEGGFTATVPSLPGCISYGKTLNEAKKMIVDAIEGYVVSLQKHNEPVPSDEESFISLISLPRSLKIRYA